MEEIKMTDFNGFETEKSIVMFGRRRNYDYIWQLESDIEAIKELSRKITKPFILSYSDGINVNFCLKKDEYFLNSSLIMWLYKNYKSDTDDNMGQFICNNSVENTAWTEELNKAYLWQKEKYGDDYCHIYYRKLTFKEEIQQLLLKELRNYKKNRRKDAC